MGHFSKGDKLAKNCTDSIQNRPRIDPESSRNTRGYSQGSSPGSPPRIRGFGDAPRHGSAVERMAVERTACSCTAGERTAWRCKLSSQSGAFLVLPQGVGLENHKKRLQTDTKRPQSDHKPQANHQEAVPEATPNSPSPRPNQIDKCATGGGRRANGGAFVDLVRSGAGAVGRGFRHGFWMVCGGLVFT